MPTVPQDQKRRLLSIACALCTYCVPAFAAAQHSATGAVGTYGSQADDAIKIGFIASLSGVGADPSRELVKGIQMYLDEHHYQMGRRPVRLIVASDGSSAATAFAMAHELIDKDHVDLIAGVHLSPCAIAVAGVCNKEHVPLVISISGADDLTQRHPCEWAIRITKTASQPNHPLGEWAFTKGNFRRVVTVASDYQYGWEAVGGFQHTFEQAGGQVIQKLWVPLGFVDFASTLSRIRRDADAVYFATTSGQAEILMKQYRQAGIKLPLLADGASVDEAVLKRIGPAALGVISAYTYSPDLHNPSNQHFIDVYKSESRDGLPGFYSEGGYATGMWIDKAVEALHGNVSDKHNLLSALQSVEIKDLPRGPSVLDAHHNIVCNVYLRKVDRIGDHLGNAEFLTFKDVSQFWTFDVDDYLKHPVYSRDYPPCTHCALK